MPEAQDNAFRRFGNDELEGCLSRILNGCFMRDGAIAKETWIKVTSEDWMMLEQLRERLERSVNAGN